MRKILDTSVPQAYPEINESSNVTIKGISFMLHYLPAEIATSYFGQKQEALLVASSVPIFNVPKQNAWLELHTKDSKAQARVYVVLTSLGKQLKYILSSQLGASSIQGKTVPEVFRRKAAGRRT